MINCLLFYGQFTSLVKMEHPLQRIVIMKPTRVKYDSMYRLGEERLRGVMPENDKLEFELQQQINEDTYVYEWRG